MAGWRRAGRTAGCRGRANHERAFPRKRRGCSWGSRRATASTRGRGVTEPPQLAPALASWQTVGGCGAGASTGTGGGVKWVGRHVKGGLLNLECQASYIDTPYGYNFIGNTMMSGALTDRWGLAVSMPYLYKYMNDPYAVGIDLANKGPGDASVSVTHAFGDTRNWLVSAAAGIPTGVFDRKFRTRDVAAGSAAGAGDAQRPAGGRPRGRRAVGRGGGGDVAQLARQRRTNSAARARPRPACTATWPTWWGRSRPRWA